MYRYHLYFCTDFKLRKIEIWDKREFKNKGHKIPSYIWTQIQIQMEVCDLDECDFLETKFIE